MTPVTLDIHSDPHRLHWFGIFLPSWEGWMLWNWMYAL